MLKKRAIALILTCTFAAPTSANIQAEMQSWFNETGTYGNVTGAQVLRGQTGTTFTGGNLYMRAPQRNYNLFNIAPPGIKAGCGGIDLFAGSFSFINSEQLTALFRNIANNAMGHAFMLAVEAVSPELAGLLKYLQDQASKLNNMNLNSCQLATGIMAPAFPDSEYMQQQAKVMGVAPSFNHYSDALHAKYKELTATPSERKQTRDLAVAANPKLKESLHDVNVTWNALQTMNISNHQLKELMMSMIGTVIIERNPSDDSKPSIQYRAPPQKIAFKDFIGDPNQTSGTSARIMACPDMECLNPGEQTVTMGSFSRYSKATIDGITDKVTGRQATGLSVGEFAIIQGTHIPLWKLISRTTAGPSAQVQINMLSQAIAVDMAYAYFDTLAKELQKALMNSKSSDSATNKEQLERMEKRSGELRTEARSMLQAEVEKVATMAELQTVVARLDQQLKVGLPQNVTESMRLFGK